MSRGHIQTYKYRSLSDDDEGIDGVDSFLRNLPQILFSIIIIIVAYGVLKFFNSPVGSALGDTLGTFVGTLTEMLDQWELIGIVLAVLYLLKQPWFHNGVSFMFGRGAGAVTRRADVLFRKMIPQDTKRKLDKAQNEWKSKTKLNKRTLANIIDEVQRKITSSSGELAFDTVLAEELRKYGNIEDFDVAFELASNYSGILTEAQLNSSAATNQALNDLGSADQIDKLWIAFRNGAFDRHGLQDHQFLQDVPLQEIDKNISKSKFADLIERTSSQLKTQTDSEEWRKMSTQQQSNIRREMMNQVSAEMNVQRKRR